MEYDKPYKNLEELVEILQTKHHLTITNKKDAIESLALIPYYDLVNGYKEYFMDDEDNFKPEISFDTLYFFHIFNKGFLNILFEYSVVIESYYKNVLARIISEEIGISKEKYLDPSYYIRHAKPFDRGYILHQLTTVYERSTDNPTKYYREHHNHIPPWILFKNVTFSNAINLLYILPKKAKIKLVDELIRGNETWDQKYSVLIYILTLIRKFRNVIAHNLKFTTFSCKNYGKNLSKKVIRDIVSPHLLPQDELTSEYGFYGLYGYIYFSLALIPDSLIKIRLSHNLVSYISSFHMGKSRDLDRFWQDQATEYLLLANLPNDFAKRLLTEERATFNRIYTRS